MADEVTGQGREGCSPRAPSQYKAIKTFCQGVRNMNYVIETVIFVVLFVVIRRIIRRVFHV